jgi:hypothetical protein
MKKPYEDYFTEMLTGEKGSVRGIGKFIISPRNNEIDGLPLIMVAGAAVFPEGKTLVLPENKEYSEMWECEIIIIPRRKYSGKIGGRKLHAFSGSRIDQILCSNYGSPEAWGKKYYEKEKP